MNGNTQPKPNVGMLYVQGLVTYLYYRLLDAGHAVVRFLLAPPRWLLTHLQTGWLRLKPWLARHKRRLFWSFVILVLLSGLVGGVVTLYLWRDSLPPLSRKVKDYVLRLTGQLRRKATPVVIVATAPVEEVPATPGGNSSGIQ